jgi:hypothetical protein
LFESNVSGEVLESSDLVVEFSLSSGGAGEEVYEADLVSSRERLLLYSEGAGALGGLVRSGKARGDWERKMVMGGFGEASPLASIEGTISDLLHVVLEHPEHEVDHDAVLELQDFRGSGGVEDDVLEGFQKVEEDGGA